MRHGTLQQFVDARDQACARPRLRCRRVALLQTLIACGLLLHSGGLARAQPAPSVQPPHLMSMVQPSLPADVTLPPSGTVEVEIVVDAQGQASVSRCDEAPALCAAVAAALATASFEPARRGEQAVAARVRITLRLSEPTPEANSTNPLPSAAPAGTSQPQPTAAGATGPTAQAHSEAAGATGPTAQAQPTAADATAPAQAQPAAASPIAPGAVADAALLSYGARASATPVRAGARRLELAEMRDMPGAFGDPFRAVEALPGVVPILSGLPYFFIRGSPPAGTQYIYDDIPVPSLYHLAVGPAAIHPRMVGPITLYSGVAPARYGRLTGGAIVGEGPERPDGQTHAETELRLLDVSGYVQTDALGGTLTAAARYGYPALLLSIFSPTVSLSYWDYQLRYTAALSSTSRFELVALGSYDSFGVSDEPDASVDITYHRIEPRYVQRLGRSELGAALLFGWEESAIGSAFQLKATRVGPRLWYEHPFGERNRLRLSGDMQGISGAFSSIASMNDLTRETNSVGLVGNVHARSLWGLALELGLRPWTALEFVLGARADAWVQSGGAQGVLDPRARVILHASDTLTFHVAAGAVHQPAVFYIPLPGIADLASDQGLQTALQSELGVGWDTPWKLRAELQFFAHRYENLVFLDTLLLRNALDTVCSSRNLLEAASCPGASVPKRINGLSYGAEVFLRRPISERLSGFVSYTLAFSSVDKVAGQAYTPSWDVRHVANVVLQYQVVAGLSGGLRWAVRSGKTTGDFILDPSRQLTRDEHLLPGFSRLDAEISYAWQPYWGRMRVALEWFNVTMSREAQAINCMGLPRSCQTEYLPAIFFPNLSVRGEH